MHTVVNFTKNVTVNETNNVYGIIDNDLDPVDNSPFLTQLEWYNLENYLFNPLNLALKFPDQSHFVNRAEELGNLLWASISKRAFDGNVLKQQNNDLNKKIKISLKSKSIEEGDALSYFSKKEVVSFTKYNQHSKQSFDFNMYPVFMYLNGHTLVDEILQLPDFATIGKKNLQDIIQEQLQKEMVMPSHLYENVFHKLYVLNDNTSDSSIS